MNLLVVIHTECSYSGDALGLTTRVDRHDCQPPVTVVDSGEVEGSPKPGPPGCPLRVRGEKASLLDENDSLETRESRTHRFVVPEEVDREACTYHNCSVSWCIYS